MAYLESLALVATTVASVATILAPPVAAAAGFAPRLGPGRAVALGLHSRFVAAGLRLSQRDADVGLLQRMTRNAAPDQYCVVVGPKGVGKTCIVDTATRSNWGVLRVSVSAGASRDKIVADALRAVTRCYLLTLDQGPSAARVQWYHALLFRVPPTIVLQAAEREAGKDYAEISASCRALAGFKFRVIVDASHNSLSDSATLTKREQVLIVEPMARELLECLEGVGDLIGALREAGLLDVVWGVVGGNPADYFKLRTAWVTSGRGDVTAVVDKFVSELLRTAIEARDTSVAADKRLSALYTLFVSADAVPLSVLVEMELVRPSPDKVLRKAVRDGETALIPATEAIAVVLRHGLRKQRSLDALRAMFPTVTPQQPSGQSVHV